ncbi:hypothetical protein [Sporomusa carbonis]|uniref:hypothetical protein n=1 Tax=Sporomusa carbonis TaxID=3076075 RepID=UPI003C7E236E
MRKRSKRRNTGKEKRRYRIGQPEPAYKGGYRICANCGKVLDLYQWSWVATNKAKRWTTVCRDDRLCYGRKKG